MQKILLGVDIGSQTIKAVQISREKNTQTLLAAGYIATPTQALSSPSTADEQVVAETINRLVHDMKVSTTNVSASLPSHKVITKVVEVPIMSQEELSSSIQWEAEQYIPLPLSKVKIDFAIISRNQEAGKMKVLLVAAPLAIIEKYMRIISLSGLTPVALETEILAESRSVVASYPTLGNIMLVSFGATTSEIALLFEHTLIYTKAYPIGGNTLTRAISQELGFETPQAEEYKKAYGMDENKLEGKVARAIEPFFTTLYTEMEKTIAYFKDQYPSSEIKNAVISGGGAKLPGFVMSFTKNLGLDSQMSNPFVNLTIDPKILPALTPDACMYTTAVGLALKDI